MPTKSDPLREGTGARLKALRLHLEFGTIRGFAAAHGFDEDRYDKWEKGKALIPPLAVEALIDRYGITSDWLYFGRKAGLRGELYTALPGAAA